MTDFEDKKKRQKALKQQYVANFQALSNILFTEDPIGINFESNTDEYDPEAGTILGQLKICRSQEQVHKVVHEAFVHWFGENTAGPYEKYDTIAARIWKDIVPKLVAYPT